MKTLLMRLNMALVLGALAFAASLPARAHHSFAMFDMSKSETLSGTVSRFQWTNPHTWVWIEVPSATGGAAELWGIEGMSPNFLGRRGWTKDTLKPGDKVTVVIRPLKDGSHGGSFIKVTLADGTVMDMMGSPPSAAAPDSPAAKPAGGTVK